MTFGAEKLEWCVAIRRWKEFENMFTGYSFWQNPRTWQTDGQDTASLHRPRLHSIARQKWTQMKSIMFAFLQTALFAFKIISSTNSPWTIYVQCLLKNCSFSIHYNACIVLIKQMYRRWYKRHRSPKTKLQIRKTKNYVLWNAGICPSDESLWKTASLRKISLKSDNQLLTAELWPKNDF